MERGKRKKLAAAGWKLGSPKDFLNLTSEEEAYVELKLNLSYHLRAQRKKRGLSQTVVAKRIGSSQSRIAKAEANDPSVSVDLLIRALFATGVSHAALARMIRTRPGSKVA